jgi:membrane protein
VFLHLETALNLIWLHETQGGSRFRRVIKSRLVAFAMVIAVGAVLLVSFFLDAGLQSMSRRVNYVLLYQPPIGLWRSVSHAALFALFTLLFATVFQYVPQAKVSWRDVWVGAVVTAFLLSVGRVLLTLYFRFSTVTSLYGAAASIMILLLWIYFSTQIFLFGARFTWHYANRFGSRSKPAAE